MPHTKTVKLRNGQAALRKLCANPRYRGKHVLVVAGQVYVARTGVEASRLFERVTRRRLTRSSYDPARELSL